MIFNRLLISLLQLKISSWMKGWFPITVACLYQARTCNSNVTCCCLILCL